MKLDAREADNNARIHKLLAPPDNHLAEISPNIPRGGVVNGESHKQNGRGKKRKAD
jgi:hypothetical protein